LIPDPCYYHFHNTTWLFDLFYESKSDGHPFPTIFNFIFTIVAGAIAGYLAIRYLMKRRRIKQLEAMRV
jgi:hypothetical protein